ncbi:GntR family transcriptional regulator [Rhodovibrio salinarum]|uniref:GntR family transcriptional regulator n=1 Tax=Rhodovibrio salinarum TaxID=1087 RepID=A0A934QL64_9PROT|nr:GntR family transcriptional regulator [Rhodovibrio salinarum]MBK1698946.1 GntR family transcriptional regulator [Rhodovibrio salinarum]
MHEEVLERIRERRWKPGDAIPREDELAREFGCARGTVNRALRALAEAGILDRRRRAGTRVALHPGGKATLDIPIIRREVEARGQTYSYALKIREDAVPPSAIREAMGLRRDDPTQRVLSVHSADGRPLAIEDRWINLAIVPMAAKADFTRISANEWLVTHASYTHGDIAFSAQAASDAEAALLHIDPCVPVFVIDRTTWYKADAVTTVRLTYAPGYRIHTRL